VLALEQFPFISLLMPPLMRGRVYEAPVHHGGIGAVPLHADVQPPLPVEPGQPERVDYEYERKGTRNLFVVVEPLAG
jgi:hypothetical protein